MKYKITASEHDLSTISLSSRFKGMIIEPNEGILRNDEECYEFTYDHSDYYVYKRFCTPLNWKERFKNEG